MADEPTTVVTPHTDTPSQAAQATEAASLGGARIPAGENALAFEGAGDGAPAPAAPAPQAPEPAPIVRSSPSDAMRAAITARFRTDRQAITEQNTDSITDFSATHIPEDFQQASGEIAPDAAPDIAPPQPDPAQSPPVEQPAPEQKYKIKVRGEEKEVTLDELKAIAQMNEAADQYLAEAKNKLHEVNTLLAQTKQNAQQPAQPGHQAAQPQGQQQPTQPTPQQPAEGDGHPDAIKQLLEAIQFGDNPEAARQLLQDTLVGMTDQVATARVQEALLQQRLKDEGARANRVIQEFASKNPELANDEKARAAVEVTTLRLQREDLRSIGVDPDHLRTDGVPTTAGDVAMAHRYYRTEGFQLHTPSEMLETALKEVNDWRGVAKPENPAPADTQQLKGAPRIEVSRERQDRLRTVPQQPSRTAAPTVQSPAPADQADRRSSIVEQMKARTKGTPRRGGASVPA